MIVDVTKEVLHEYICRREESTRQMVSILMVADMEGPTHGLSLRKDLENPLHLRGRIGIDIVLFGSWLLGLYNTAIYHLSKCDSRTYTQTSLLVRLKDQRRLATESTPAVMCNIPLHDRFLAWRTDESLTHQNPHRLPPRVHHCLGSNNRHASALVSLSSRGRVSPKSGWSSCTDTRRLSCVAGTGRRAIHGYTAMPR